jgi:predicted secreted protein
MTRETISRALSLIDQRYVIEALEPERAVQKETHRKQRAARKVWRTVLIAAVISAFFAVTAFAVGYSIHQRRQQELRELWQAEENNVTSYEEYPVPSNEPEEVQTVEDDGQWHVTLLSTVIENELLVFYYNLSPMEPEEVPYINHLNHEISSTYDGMSYYGTTPVEENGETVYDAATKTVTMRGIVHLIDVSSDDFPLTVTIVHFANARLRDDGVEEFDYIEEYGSLVIPSLKAETNVRKFMFDTPVEFKCEELGKSGRILGIELTPTGATWLLEHDDSDRFYYSAKGLTWAELSEEEQEWQRQVNGPWAKAIDDATWGTLHMADGSDFTVHPGESGNYEDGVVKRYVSWSMKSINLDDVVSITIGDTTIDLK